MADAKEIKEILEKKKFSDLIKCPIITVLVGQEQAAYHIHKGLLKDNSDLMAKALNEPYTENENNTIKLPNEDPNLFGYFVLWLYNRINLRIRCITDVPKEFEIEFLSDYVRFYALGERLASKKFQDFILALLSARWEVQPDTDEPGFWEEHISGIIEAVARATTDLIENEKDDMQKYLFWVWNARRHNRDGHEGWLESVHFRRELRENPDFAANLISEKRNLMISTKRCPFKKPDFPKHTDAHECS